MGRFIHYEYGGGVYEHRRFMFLKLLVVCVLLFGVTAATPRMVQKYITGDPAPIILNEKPTEPVPLQQPAVAETEVAKDAIKDPDLVKLIETWAKRNPGQEWGVAVERLEGGRIVADYQPTTKFYPASLYKLLITQSLSDKIRYQDWAKKKVYDYRGTHTYLKCVDLMIKESDNPCGEAVGNAIGWKTVDYKLGSIGLTNTKLNSNDNRYTTAGDMRTFLQHLHEGSIFDTYAKDRILGDMKVQKFREGIPAGSPDCTVYDKIGDLDGYKHDAGIVECGDVTYSLVIMSKGGSYGQIAELSSLINGYMLSD